LKYLSNATGVKCADGGIYIKDLGRKVENSVRFEIHFKNQQEQQKASLESVMKPFLHSGRRKMKEGRRAITVVSSPFFLLPIHAISSSVLSLF
jgi:hypothetical protein